jgi:hypothetical protein
VEGTKRCQKCVDDLTKWRRKQIKQGLCPSHKNRRLAPGASCCEDCIQAKSEWYRNNKTRKKGGSDDLRKN